MNARRHALGLLALVWPLHAAVDDRLVLPGPAGRSGGHLVSAQRTEPKTLNWAVAADSGSREVLQCLMADLIHINRQSLATEPALAKSWKVSRNGLHWELTLRQGVKFSDGHPFDADDVVFTFQAILDEQVHSPQRDLLMLEGKPIAVHKLDSYRVAFDLPQPYSVPDRLFDGVFILPRHKLEAAWKQGKLAEAWGMSTPPSESRASGRFGSSNTLPAKVSRWSAIPTTGRSIRPARNCRTCPSWCSYSPAPRTTRCCAFVPVKAISSIV